MANIVKIGDYITLKNIKVDEYLSAEGILSEDAFVGEWGCFDNSLFQICLPRQYSASRELAEYIENREKNATEQNTGDNDIQEEINAKKHFDALKRGEMNENKMNETYMKNKFGSNIRYGDAIQLLHVKSRKFITIIGTEVAHHERENIRVCLHTTGTTNSWFVLQPRFKINQTGDFVLSNSEVKLNLAERPSEYLHGAEREHAKGLREVNASLEPTSWLLGVYQSSAVSQDPNVILASQYVYLHDPETQSVLSILKRPLILQNASKKDTNNEDDVSEVSDDDSIMDISAMGDVVIEKMGESISSSALWMIETRQINVGGRVQWKQDMVRLRHVNSGLYLSMNRENSTDDAYNVCVSSNPLDKNNLFSVHELHSTGNFLLDKRAVQISHGRTYLTRGDPREISRISHFLCKGSVLKSQSIFLFVNKYSPPMPEPDEHSPVSQPLDCIIGAAIKDFLDKYFRQTPPFYDYNIQDIDPLDVVYDRVWPKLENSDVARYLEIVERTIQYLHGVPMSDTEMSPTKEKFPISSKVADEYRQNMFREQGTLEIVLCQLNCILPLFRSDYQSILDDNGSASSAQNINASFTADSDNSYRKDVLKSHDEVSFRTKSLLRMGGKVAKALLRLLHSILKKNNKSQSYVAQHMHVVLGWVGVIDVAADVVTEMLSDNLELQQQCIGPREIQTFIDQICSPDSKMNPMYFNMLQSFCSCSGRGIARNQAFVMQAIFPILQDIFISVKPVKQNSSSDDKNFGTFSSSLYVPKENVADRILGGQILTDGFPVLVASWNTPSSDFSAIALFQKHIVPISEMFKANGDVRNVAAIHLLRSFSTVANPRKQNNQKRVSTSLPDSAPTKNITADRKMAVGSFLVSELHLAAELCLDRNYVAISKLEKTFSFETLISILAGYNRHNNVSIGDLKGAAARLITNLYVDRESETTSHTPCLTRPWSVLLKGIVALPGVEEDRTDRFCLLQHIISEHIRSINTDGGNWDAYSFYIMQMLKKLISLQFYNTKEKLDDIISPLLTVLNRTNVIDEETKKKSQMNFKAKSQTSLNASSDTSDALALLSCESYYWLCMALSMITTGLATYEILLHPPYDFTIVYYLVSLIYFIELFIRFALIIHDRVYILNDMFILVDAVVVALDIVVIFIPIGDIGAFTNSIRLLRLLHLLFNVGIEENGLSITSLEDNDKWMISTRYSSAPSHELRTMVEMVEILNAIQKIVDERNFVLCLNEFSDWYVNSSALKNCNELAVTAFEKALSQSSELRVLNDTYYETAIDLLMYDCSPLVQNVLNLIMQHNSVTTTMLDNVRNAQILSSTAREHQYHIVHDLILQLDRNIETHALWCNLSNDKEKEICNNCINILKSLIDGSRIKLKILQFDEEYEPDTIMQNLLRNFGCFEVCFKLIHKLTIALKENTLSDATQATKNILIHCNTLLYWYCIENPTNQQDVFNELNFFLESIDSNINSHKVLTAIFKNNEKLMRKVPLQTVADFTDKICNNGRFPQYLSILNSICYVGEKNILENQYEIVKQISSPLRFKKIVSFFCPISHPDYQKKIKLMTPYLQRKDISCDEIAAELSYHIELMKVLTACTVGYYNIATIETKVQQMFHFSDLIEVILDSSSMLLVKIKSGLFFYNAMLDVEMVLPGLQYTTIVWKLLYYCYDVLATAKDDLRQIERNGWDNINSSRQRIEFTIVCIMIVRGFFKSYYDPFVFSRDHGGMFGAKYKNTEFALDRMKGLINNLFDRIKQIYDLDSPVLSIKHKEIIYKSLEMLCKAKEIHIEDFVDISHIQDNTERYAAIENNDTLSEDKISKKLIQFVDTLVVDSNIQNIKNDEFQVFIKLIESLPSIHDKSSTSPVRYEALIEKLVKHVRGGITYQNHGSVRVKHISDEWMKTSTWIIKMFRTMIENRWGMTIYQRDDEGGEEQDKASAGFVKILNDCQVTSLCLDLIAPGIDMILINECIKLLVAMLFQEGGNLHMQKTMYNHLAHGDSEFFFQQIRNIIQQLITWHDWRGVHLLEEGQEPDLPEEIITIRCIQLMCEGHYMDNQNIFCEQPGKTFSINILDDLVAYLMCCGKFPCRTSTTASLSVASAILEVIQGPCEKNQLHFALNTSLVETLNHQMRARSEADCDPCQELELKKTAIDILQGLLEGQGKKVAVYERVLSVIHLDVVQIMCSPEKKDDDVEVSEEIEEISMTLQTEALVLLQMLCDFRPSLRNDISILQEDETTTKKDSSRGNVACVEILWRGELQRRFFNIPAICNDFTEKSKSDFVEFVDRSSNENKLLDMYVRAEVIYREILHQKWLRELNVHTVFSKQNQNRATWVTFTLSCTLNLIFIGYFSGTECFKEPDTPPAVVDDAYVPTYTCGDPALDGGPRAAVDALNILQIIFSSFTLILFLVVRSPVIYQNNVAKGQGMLLSIVNTATDPMTLYYVVYLLLAVVSYSVDHVVTLLLLDVVVKNTYAMDVFIAIFTPIRQLTMAIVLCIFVMYIFAINTFIYVNNDYTLVYVDDCRSLYGCFKYVVGYGATGGITGFNETIDNMWYFSFAYDICIRFVLLNVIRGITVDTFSSLRLNKIARLKDTTETCFICGIDKQTFDRSRTSRGFKPHIKLEHNMWNYLYFIIYIWEQDKDDDDGLEQFVRRSIVSKDISWFPTNRALSLNVVEEDGNAITKDLFVQDIQKFEHLFGSKISLMQSDISANVTLVKGLMDQLTYVEEFIEMPAVDVVENEDPLNELPAVKPSPILPLKKAPSLRSAAFQKKASMQSLLNEQKVVIEIVEIIGLIFPARTLESLIVRVSSPIGDFKVSKSNVMSMEGGKSLTLAFDPVQVCVEDAYHSSKANTIVKIQIARATNSTDLPRYVGHVLFTLGELVAAPNSQFKRSFEAVIQNQTCRGEIILNSFFPG